jgi:hypothetical protein
MVAAREYMPWWCGRLLDRPKGQAPGWSRRGQAEVLLSHRAGMELTIAFVYTYKLTAATESVNSFCAHHFHQVVPRRLLALVMLAAKLLPR